ncbi:MAG: hypothetical protein MJ240_09110, partial [Kiritimatiellae bacterium]|nr:hypothetical protein [Kiritimatiellia bacterium]
MNHVSRSVRTWLALFAVTSAGGAFALKTPETSSLFVAHTDTVSQVVSYILKPGILGYHHHQSVYFTSRCMTDDGRFLVFSVSPNEFTEPHPGLRHKAIIDFEKDVAYVLADTRNWYTPWVDVERDQMWYITRDGVHRRDLLVDPNKDILVCPAPPEIRSYGTHLTLSPDRRKIFLDAHKESVYKQGVINLDTGKWEEWSQAPFCCNHGQFNPVDPTMGMCAFEYAWFLTPAELPPELQANPPMDANPYVTLVRRPRDYIYPRLWLFRNTGEKWMVPSRITNGASHEIFTWDGKGFYWCSGGVVHADLATERQTLIVPCLAAHATMTEDYRYLVFDSMWGHWCRGGGWSVAFWNRAEHRGVWLYNRNPPMAIDKAHESILHPDPHPMFVCKDKYIVCTAIFPAASGVTNDNYMALSVTPVAQLVAKTQAKLTPVAPKHFELPDWQPGKADDTPLELALDTRKVSAHFRDLARPAISPLRLAYTTYGIEAQVGGLWQPVPVEPLQPPMEYGWGVTLRFTPPKGATALRGVVDAPGRFEMRDSELCDNLFNRRNLHDLYPPKAAASYAPGATPLPAASCQVGGAAGKPVKFDFDVRNFAWKTWWGNVRLEQYDAAGQALGGVLDLPLEHVEIKADKRLQFRETGRLAATAAEVRLYLEGVVDGGGAPQLEVQCLNLRPAQVLTSAFEPELPRNWQIVPPASGRINFTELDDCLASNATAAVTRSGEGLVVTADAAVRTPGTGTVNSRSGSNPLALDLQGHTLTLGGKGRFVIGGLNVKRPGRLELVDGVHLALEHGNTRLNGSAANVLACKRAGSLQFLDTKGDLDWTLDASGLDQIRVWRSGKTKDFTTNVCYWTGPVRTGPRQLPLLLGANSFSFRGPVSGSGLQAFGDPRQKGHLGLFSPSNSLVRGVGVQDACLHLACEGALPAEGGALTLTNACVELMDDALDYHLPVLEAVASGPRAG